MATLTLSQSGVVPYRYNDDNTLEVLLITTRRSRQWSFPKGHLEPGMTPEESAENEAFEEAGLHGTTDSYQLGVFAYQKKGYTIDVVFFPMLVTRQDDTWLEQLERERRWCSPGKAMVLLEARKMGFLVEALLAWLATEGSNEAASA